MGDDAAFRAAYDTALRRWPDGTRGFDVPTAYGPTRVQVCGVEHGTPVVLLPGGGTTSLVWAGVAAALAPSHRVYGVDLMGDAGLSRNTGVPLRGADAPVRWLDGLLDGLGLDSVRLCGHSYGAWIALRHAIGVPGRAGRLALVDPVQCFAGMNGGYLLRAVPQLLGPSAGRARTFHRWETGGETAPGWGDLLDAAAEFRPRRLVRMRRPARRELERCTVPVLVATAGRSRAHDPARAAAGARDTLPHATVATLPGATHHSLPLREADELGALLADFLA